METWPSSFPLPTTSFSGDNADSSVRTQMDSGRIRQRPRFTGELTMLNVTWNLTDIQFIVFKGFHKDRLNLGNDWFMAPLPVGDGIHSQQVRFVGGKYRHTYEHVGHWNVSGQLELYEPYQMAPEVLDAYITIGFSDIEIENFLDAVDDAYEVTHSILPSLLI